MQRVRKSNGTRELWRVIPLYKVEKAELLLAEGISHRRTAERVGVSRMTVSRIAGGVWRKKYQARMAKRQQRQQKVEPAGRTIRCPGCGAMVLAPCHACKIRALLAAGRLRRIGSRRDIDAELSNDFADPGERERYQELKRRKRAGISDEPVWVADCPKEDETGEDEPGDEELRNVENDEARMTNPKSQIPNPHDAN